MRRLTCPICHVSARDAAVDGSRCDPGDGQVRARRDYSETANSPSSDQSSCGIVKLMMRGVATRCGGKVCCAVLKWSDCTCAAPAAPSRNASTSTYSVGSSMLRAQSNQRHPGSLRVAWVNGPAISGQVSAYSGRTRNFAVMKIMWLRLLGHEFAPARSDSQPEWLP